MQPLVEMQLQLCLEWTIWNKSCKFYKIALVLTEVMLKFSGFVFFVDTVYSVLCMHMMKAVLLKDD